MNSTRPSGKHDIYCISPACMAIRKAPAAAHPGPPLLRLAMRLRRIHQHQVSPCICMPAVRMPAVRMKDERADMPPPALPLRPLHQRPTAARPMQRNTKISIPFAAPHHHRPPHRPSRLNRPPNHLSHLRRSLRLVNRPVRNRPPLPASPEIEENHQRRQGKRDPAHQNQSIASRLRSIHPRSDAHQLLLPRPRHPEPGPEQSAYSPRCAHQTADVPINNSAGSKPQAQLRSRY